jgi:hypothetical protein
MTSQGNFVSSACDPKIRPNDVIMGRGSGPNRWKGNIRFRQLVLQSFQDFIDTSTSSSFLKERGQYHVRPTSFSALDAFVKNQLASNVLSAIETANGRFLQKLTKKEFELKANPKPSIIYEQEEEGKGGSKFVFVYVEASRRKAMEKIKQTFRFLNDQKQARRLSKVAEAQRISTEAVKASFARPSSIPAFPPPPMDSDRMISSLKMHDLFARPTALVGQHVNESDSSLMLQGLPRAASLPVYPFNQDRNAAPQAQLEQQLWLELDILVASSLRTEQIKERLRQRMISALSGRDALDLARRLAMEAFSPSSFINSTSCKRHNL